MANRKRKSSSKRTIRTAPGATRAPKTQTRKPADGSAFRSAVARRSSGLIVTLSGLPQYMVPAAIVVLALVGLLAPIPIAVIALALIVTFMAWLAFLSWPVLARPQRAMRVLAIVILTLAAIARILGWL